MIRGAAFAHPLTAPSRADAAVGVLDGLRGGGELGRVAEAKRIFVRRGVKRGRLQRRDARGFGNGNDEQRIHSGARAEAVVPAGEFAQRADAELREAIANLFGKGTKIGCDHFRFAGETRAKFFVLRGDAHGTSVEMALAGHDAADGEKRGGAEAEFVGAEKSGNDDVARKFQAAVHAKRNAGAQASANKSVMRFA